MHHFLRLVVAGKKKKNVTEDSRTGRDNREKGESAIPCDDT